MSQEVTHFIGFNGHGHSGHTLVAALLDSHPQIAMANTYGRYDSVEGIIETTKTPLWDGPKYNFTMPGHQGSVEDVRAVGHTTLNPVDEFGLEPITIGCIRNPYDVIAAQAVKLQNRSDKPLETAVDYYLANLENLFASHFFVWIDIPGIIISTLIKICDTVELRYTNKWLKAAKMMIDFPSVRKHEVEWDLRSDLIVRGIINKYPHMFGRYSFDTL